jgi:hypothetical protein
MNSPRDAVIDFTMISRLTCIFLGLELETYHLEEWFPRVSFWTGKIRGQVPVIPIAGS